MKIGIVGHEAGKFTPVTEASAKSCIRAILSKNDILVSGGCHLGGIDIWAEEIADELGVEKIIHRPAILRWSGGFKERNLRIAKDSDEVHVIVVGEYSPDYSGRRFDYCYHCDSKGHVKSGGCWTARKAVEMYGKKAVWHVIDKDGSVKRRELKRENPSSTQSIGNEHTPDTEGLKEGDSVGTKLFFIDEHGFKRPKPPAGFVRFEWKYRKTEFNKENLCPKCGEFGYVSGDWGFTDPKAQAFMDEIEKRDDISDYDMLCQIFEGDMIKCHWSRWSTWVCMNCGCVIWEDMVSGYPKDGERWIGWFSYYKPDGQKNLGDSFTQKAQTKPSDQATDKPSEQPIEGETKKAVQRTLVEAPEAEPKQPARKEIHVYRDQNFLKDFVKAGGGMKTTEDVQREKEQKRQEEIDYWKRMIVEEHYLWDMRCWDKHKDREEMMKWLENGCEPNNCGYAVFCIENLLNNGTTKEEIIGLMMENPHIEWKNRLVKCFSDPQLCPAYREHGNYKDCNCSERCK